MEQVKTMRRTAFLVLVIVSSAAILFAAYPNEYPVYLRMLGFSKNDIHSLRGGGVLTRMVRDKMPGEYGVIAATVSDVPVYYYRDYHRKAEYFKSLRNFHQVGEFQSPPTLLDLKPLRFDDCDLDDFLGCKLQDCGLKLSAEEIAEIPENAKIRTEEDREKVSDLYRQILLSRLEAYQNGGVDALSSYQDGKKEYHLGEIFRNHLLKFPHLDAYFPVAEKYLLDYPRFKNRRVPEFFFWSKEYMGDKPIISLYHVLSFKVGEDQLMMVRLVYANHYLLSSLAVTHLINYADNGPVRTLLVYEQRTLTDLRGNPFDAIARNILRSNLEKRAVTGFTLVGKTMAERYRNRSQYPDFPYGLSNRDQQ
jgi:hypothetical protein